MKHFAFLRRYAYPAIVLGLGVLLLLNPDSLSALLSRALGWVVLAVGVGFVIAAVSDRHSRFVKVMGAMICFLMGTWLLRNPLAIAQGLGRLAGICLLVRCGQDAFESNTTPGKLLAGAGCVLGFVLLLLPMTTSRLVFRIIGVVLLALGAAVLIARLRQKKLEGSGQGPIDL